MAKCFQCSAPLTASAPYEAGIRVFCPEHTVFRTYKTLAPPLIASPGASQEGNKR